MLALAAAMSRMEVSRRCKSCWRMGCWLGRGGVAMWGERVGGYAVVRRKRFEGGAGDAEEDG